MHQRVVLAPQSPVAFLTHILDAAAPPRPPTMVLICAARSDFLRAAVTELQDTAAAAAAASLRQPPDVLRATLARVAAARHIRAAFLPSVAHLRAYLSVLPCPPVPSVVPAQLLVYGFLDAHRDGGWSAQSIGCSAACLVEAAARAGLVVTLREPTGWGEGEEGLREGGKWPAVYEEQIPLLSTTAEMREDGTWGVPCTTARTILQRWFTFDDS